MCKPTSITADATATNEEHPPAGCERSCPGQHQWPTVRKRAVHTIERFSADESASGVVDEAAGRDRPAAVNVSTA